MKSILISLVLLASGSAMADGWSCWNKANDIKVEVYNQVQPEFGTRNAAIMIVSDQSVSEGRQTIATFESSDSLLVNTGANYVAKVDLRFNNSGRSGENFAGTKLGNVAFVTLDINFSYNEPVRDGQFASGLVTVIKRNGTDDITFPVWCNRYLKGN